MFFTIALSTVLTALFLFFWGWLFAVLLKKSSVEHFGQVSRPEKEIKVWAIGLEKLAQGFLLTLIYRQLVPFVEVTWLNGLAFGALVGALLEVTYFFSMWVNFRVGLRGVLVNSLVGWARMTLAGILVSLLAK